METKVNITAFWNSVAAQFAREDEMARRQKELEDDKRFNRTTNILTGVILFAMALIVTPGTYLWMERICDIQ